MWYNIPNAFSREYCKEIIDYFNTKDLEVATLGDGAVNTSIRETDIRFVATIPENNLFEQNLHFCVDRVIQQGNTEWFGYDLAHNEAPQFGKYKSETKGFYDWHIDKLNDNKKFIRKLSVVILLNDTTEYTGGRLELDHNEAPKNFLNAGDAVLFPSYLKHRVTPVETGDRYSLVCWSSGPAWR